MSGSPEVVVSKFYDLSTNDYVLCFECGDSVVLELRAKDRDNNDPTKGPGIRVCIDNSEMPLDWFRQTVNTYMPWLMGEQR